MVLEIGKHILKTDGTEVLTGKAVDAKQRQAFGTHKREAVPWDVILG